MKTIQIDGDYYTIASKWSELTNNQIIALAKMFLNTKEFIRLKVIYCLSLLGLRLKYSNPINIKGESLYYVKQNRKNIYLLSNEQIYSIIASIDWMFYNEESEQGKKVMINPRLTQNPCRILRFGLKRFIGPDAGLGNITYNEFMHAETFLYRFDKTQNPIWMAKFIATLWRPRKKGKQLPFDQELIEEMSSKTIRIKPYHALAIRWYYSGCKFFLSKKYPKVFGGSSSGKESDPFEGYLNLARTLAGHDATKVISVMDSNLYFTLGCLNDMIELQEKSNKK